MRFAWLGYSPPACGLRRWLVPVPGFAAALKAIACGPEWYGYPRSAIGVISGVSSW